MTKDLRGRVDPLPQVKPYEPVPYKGEGDVDPFRPERGITHVARDPVDPLYAKKWNFKLPASHAQALDAPGRPSAHRDFLRSHDALVGEIPNEEPRWRRRHNYYLNCVRDVDRNIAALLAELDASGLTERTIVILTADHGDMDGAHQLHAKGAAAYREQNHVPLIIAHPAYPGGRRCRVVADAAIAGAVCPDRGAIDATGAVHAERGHHGAGTRAAAGGVLTGLIVRYRMP